MPRKARKQIFMGGRGKTSEEYSFLTVQNVRLSLVKNEADLFNTKWWDYRFLHPMEATYLFASMYVRAFRAAMRHRADINEVTHLRPLKDPDFLRCDQRVITGMWKARQQADKHGIPYDFWCDSAMLFAQTCNWKYLPKSFQLYIDKVKPDSLNPVSMVDFILRRWQERDRDSIQHATLPFYVEPKTPLHPYQMAHMRMLINRVERAHNRVPLVYHLVYDAKLLPPELVLSKFGDDVGGSLLRRAKALLPSCTHQ